MLNAANLVIMCSMVMSQMSLDTRDINVIVYISQFAEVHMRNEECCAQWRTDTSHLATAVHPGHSCEIMPVTGSAIIPRPGIMSASLARAIY